MPLFAASPVETEKAAEEKRDTLKAEFLRSNHMEPRFDFTLENIRTKEQLQERIDLLRRLDEVMEDALKSEGDPTIARVNLSIVAMPLGVDVNLSGDEEQYSSSTPSMLIFAWNRLETGGFAIKMITAG
jgi:hypothetical protein